MKNVNTENYILLLKLIPNLSQLNEGDIRVSRGEDYSTLYLDILDIHDTHTVCALAQYCTIDGVKMPVPDMEIEIDHKQQCVNALTFQSPSTIQEVNSNSKCGKQANLQKKLNLFLKNWLCFCLAQGHCFSSIQMQGTSHSSHYRMDWISAC